MIFLLYKTMPESDNTEQRLVIPKAAGNKLYCLVKKTDQEPKLKDFFTTEKFFMTQGGNGYNCGVINTPLVPMYNRFGFRVIARIRLENNTFSNLAISIVFDYSNNNIYFHSHSLYSEADVKYKERCFCVKSIESYEQFKAGKGSTDELEIQKEFAKECVKKFLSHQFEINEPVTLNEGSEGFTLLEEAIDNGIKKDLDQNEREVIGFIQQKKTHYFSNIKKYINEIKKASDNSYMLPVSVTSLFFASCVSLAIAISSRYFILKSPLNILHLKFVLLAASSVFSLSALYLTIKFALVSRSMIKNNILEQRSYLEKLLLEDKFYTKNSTSNTSTLYDEPNEYLLKPNEYLNLKQLGQNVTMLALNFKAYTGKKLTDKELEIKKKYLKDSKYSTKTNFLTTLSIYFFAIVTIPAMSLFYYFGEVAKAPQSLKIVAYVCLSLTCISAIATVALYTESIVRSLSEIKENQAAEQDPAEIVAFNKNNDPTSLFEFTSKGFL